MANDPDAAFRHAVKESRRIDPMPTLERLASATGVNLDDLIHHALVRWVSAGAEALLSLDSLALKELVDARRQEDWQKVGGIIDWIDAGRRGHGYE